MKCIQVYGFCVLSFQYRIGSLSASVFEELFGVLLVFLIKSNR